MLACAGNLGSVGEVQGLGGVASTVDTGLARAYIDPVGVLVVLGEVVHVPYEVRKRKRASLLLAGQANVCGPAKMLDLGSSADKWAGRSPSSFSVSETYGSQHDNIMYWPMSKLGLKTCQAVQSGHGMVMR